MTSHQVAHKVQSLEVHLLWGQTCKLTVTSPGLHFTKTSKA